MIHEVGFGVKFIKDYNELKVLRFIKNNHEVSRAEISKQYNISKAAVSDIVNRLITQRYVKEIGVGLSTKRGGRKPVLLKFNQRAGYVIGIEIRRSYANIALIDLNAEVHKFETFNYTAGYSIECILDRLYLIIEEFLITDWVEDSQAIGIGVAVPGLIDYNTGCIKVSDTLINWIGFPIKENIETKFSIPTVIENDVKAKALSECLFGAGKDYDNLVNLWIGDGIGAGIIIDGHLIRGITASAGEVGYDELGFFIRDVKNFPLLYKNQKDFGDILSNKLLISAASNALNNGQISKLERDQLTIDSIVKAAENDDPLANKLLTEFGDLLGILCINLVNTLNMELLIISGKLVQNSDILIKYVTNKIHKDLLSVPAHAVKIVSAELKEKCGVLGAAGLILEDLFYKDRINVIKYRDVFKQASSYLEKEML
ncbi:ROK family transcriptional regulator [Calditrichota bacterium]